MSVTRRLVVAACLTAIAFFFMSGRDTDQPGEFTPQTAPPGAVEYQDETP